MTETKKPKIKREKSTTTKGHYVTNATLLPAVLEAKQLNKVTDKLIKMIYMIADRYSRKANFAGYSFREDMVASAVMNLCNSALKFNPEKSSNPFSFYTTAIHNSFLQFILDEKKHRNIRDALRMDAGANPSFNFMQGEKSESDFEMSESDNMHSMMTVEDASYYVEDDLPEVETEEPVAETTEGSEVEEDIFIAKKEGRKVVKEVKYKYQNRMPSDVVKLNPKNLVLDERGNYVLAPAAEAPKKKAPAKKAVKKEVVKKVAAKTPAKKTTKKEKVAA